MRHAVLAALALWLTPVVSAGVFSFGISFWPALLVGGLIAVVIATIFSPAVTATLAPALARRPAIALGAGVLALAAIVQVAPLSLFMADVNRVSCAPGSTPFQIRHNCLTAYVEAARMAQEGGINLYDPTRYQPRTFGSIVIDRYHYPPPFLLVPASINALSSDYFAARALWFSLQSMFLLFVLLWLARWTGGQSGAWVAIAGTGFLVLPQTMVMLQGGNFQLTAFALALVGFLILVERPSAVAAFMFALPALAKVFPGILAVWLIVTKRWTALATVAVAGIVILGLTWAVVGSKPFVDFATVEAPGLASGQSFPQSERPPTIPLNESFYGLTVRLRVLGIDALDAATGRRLLTFYGLFVIALVAFAASRMRRAPESPRDRLRLVIVALAIITLASFRSPFVGSFYGLVSSFLLGLLMAAGALGLWRWFWVAAVVVIAAMQGSLPVLPPPAEPALSTVALSAATFSLAFLMNIWAVLHHSRPGTGETSPLPTSRADSA